MALLQAWVLALLLLSVLAVERTRLYFRQCWSHAQAAQAISAAGRVPWTILFDGSSQVYAGIIPADVEEGLREEGAGGERVFALGLLAAVAHTELLAYREVRRGHHPSAVVIGLAPRDLNARDFREKLRVAAESSASLPETLRLAAYDPVHRWLLPWYVVRRDLATPLQALASCSADFEDRVRVLEELSGSAWEPEDSRVAGYTPYRSIGRDELVAVMRSESRGYTTADFPDSILSLVQEIRGDGAVPFILVMPLSGWGEAQLPGRSARVFGEEVARIQSATGVRVLRGSELAPELASQEYFVDSVEHLSADGARRLSRAVGRAIGEELGGRGR